MDLSLLLSSGSGFRKKFSATLIIFAIAIVAYTFTGLVSQEQDLLILIKSIYLTILACGLLIIPILGIKMIRWRLITAEIGLEIPIRKDIKCWLSSQAFLGTPGGSGLAIRSLLLKRKHNLAISSTLPAVIFERLSDLSSILILVLLINITFFLKKIFIVPTIFSILLTFIFTKITRKESKLINNLLYKLLSRLNPGKEASNTSLLTGLKKLMSPRLIIMATLVGLLPWMIEGFGLYLILNSIGNFQIDWSTATFAHASSVLLGALSLLPGGLGTAEATTVGLLSLSGVPINIATPSTILIRLLTLWLATIIGIISLLIPNKTNKSS